MVAEHKVTRWKKTDSAWLALAVLAHAALLLLPLGQPQSPANLRPVLALKLIPFTLKMEPQPVAEIQPLPAPLQKPGPLPSPDIDSKSAPPAALAALTKLPTPDQSTTKPAVESFSAARLVDLVARSTFTQSPSAVSRQLGSIDISRQAPAWRSRNRTDAIMSGPNRFDGMLAPLETEVVDRWQAADGSHNVVVNLPGGETLCGRAEAWNPMQPLVEHIMMFRECGGGGKRTFTMAAREAP